MELCAKEKIGVLFFLFSLFHCLIVRLILLCVLLYVKQGCDQLFLGGCMGLMKVINRAGALWMPQRAHFSIYWALMNMVLNLNLHISVNYIQNRFDYEMSWNLLCYFLLIMETVCSH